MSNPRLLILNGPGLASLDAFADASCGITTLEEIRKRCQTLCEQLQVRLDFRQTDDQDQMIQWIGEAAHSADAVIINQLGCTERTPVDYPRYCQDLEITATLTCPMTEIHMTNVLRYDQGAFRSLQGPAGKTALVCGLGADSYTVAIRAAAAAVNEVTA